jgi:2-polyprenyl-3-methyl-5-hydroxy-6-metoxy-1,4-benzoquinol methylase
MRSSETAFDYRESLYTSYRQAVERSFEQQGAGSNSRVPYFRQLVTRHFPVDKGSHVFDAGCGAGDLIGVARSLGYVKIQGVDVSHEQIGKARTRGLECVAQGDVIPALLDFPPQTLDLVVAFDVLEHFSKIEVLEFLDAARQALKADGRVIVHAPNAESPFGGAMRYGDFTHELAFTRHSVVQLVIATGYRQVAFYEDVPVAHGLKSTARRLLWPLIRSLYRALTAVETGDAGRGAILSRNLLAVITK